MYYMKIFSVFIAFFFIFHGHSSGKNRNLEPLQIPKLVCDLIESPMLNGDGTIRFLVIRYPAEKF